ncbi:MAG: hypothetical protein PHE87_06755 [Victivallaceae bacterium]|nr:hypothetical protein [Victivallaceae bacterium]
MKKCPFCAEDIQNEAIKCKHCGEFMNASARSNMPRKKFKWYFSGFFIFVAVGCVGPLALPLIWWRPRTSRTWKIVFTIIILIISWFMFKVTLKSIEAFDELSKLLQDVQ